MYMTDRELDHAVNKFTTCQLENLLKGMYAPALGVLRPAQKQLVAAEIKNRGGSNQPV